MEYYIFDDLIFKPHPNMRGLQARFDFENGYGVSVVRFKSIYGGYGSYTSNENEWELAIFKDNTICYDTPITDDVIGHLKEYEVTDIMKQIQDLPKNEL